MNDALTARVRAMLIAGGFTPAIAELVSAGETPAIEDGAPPRGLLEIAYQGVRKGVEKRIVVAQISTPTVDGVVDTAGDVQDFGRLLIAAMPSLPPGLRNEPLPEALAGLEDGIGSDLARATRLSRAAIENER